MMNILLIGGTGVLSSAVTELALKKGLKVTMINRGRRKLPNGVEVVISDHTNYDYIRSQLQGKHFDAVIDFLCYHSEQLKASFELYSDFTNQYFFISSCAVYAKGIGDFEKTEDAPKINPIWSYSVEKWACEELLMKMACEKHCHYTIVRPAVTYGDTRIPYGIYPEYGYHWTLAARILNNKPIITWNNGRNGSNMLRVEDFAVGVVGLIGNELAYNEAFNICGDENPTWDDVLNIMEKKLNHSVSTIDITPEFYAEQMPNRAEELLGGRCGNSKCSNEKIKKVVPEFKQTIGIEDGVAQTIEAYRNNHYQMGIDWVWEAQTDKIIKTWCTKNGISTKGMSLGYVDYLQEKSFKNMLTYQKIYHSDDKLIYFWKIINKLYKLIKR